jgi:hypothetical protein
MGASWPDQRKNPAAIQRTIFPNANR